MVVASPGSVVRTVDGMAIAAPESALGRPIVTRRYLGHLERIEPSRGILEPDRLGTPLASPTIIVPSLVQ